MSGHKTNLNKRKSSEIMSPNTSEHSGKKMSMNDRKRDNNRLMTHWVETLSWDNEETKQEIKIHL